MPQAFAEDRQRIFGMAHQRQGTDKLRTALGIGHIPQHFQQLGIVRGIIAGPE